MGAISGHLNHLYDNLGLSFGKMKEIFSKAYSGELQVSEKTDGQNLFLSFSPATGEPKVAINKTELRSGGMSVNDLALKYEKKPFLQEVFLDALEFWEAAVRTFPKEALVQLFGETGTRFYSSEVLDPRSKNVVDYGIQAIIVHPQNHVETLNGNIIPLEDEEADDILRSALEKVQPNDTGYSISRAAVSNLADLSSNKSKNEAIRRLDDFLASSGLSDNNTVGDYLIQSLEYTLPKDIADESREGLILKALGAKGINTGTILKPLSKEQQVEAKEWLNVSKKLKKEFIFPLEKIVHDFTVDVLEGLESVYILNNSKATEDLRQEVSAAIDAIKRSGNEHAIAILNHQLKKLGGVENITTASEGVVFAYDGDLYKFTGNFAPINQILGLFKFGRGKNIPPMKNLVKESLINVARLAVFPGGFKPPHHGHYNSAQYLSRFADKILVYISPKDRDADDVKISAKQSKQIWEIFTKNDPKFVVEIAPTASPVKAVYDLIEVMAPNQKLVLGIGGKDAEAGEHRYKRAQGWADKKTPGLQIEIVPVPNTFEFNPTGVSGTDMRKFVATDQEQNFLRNLPDHLSVQDKLKVWSIAKGNKMVTENLIKETLAKVLLKKHKLLNEVAASKAQRNLAGMALSFKRGKMSSSYMKSLDKETKKKLKSMAAMSENELEKLASTPDEDIQEMSAMGAGAVAGGAGKVFHDEDELVNEVMSYMLGLSNEK